MKDIDRKKADLGNDMIDRTVGKAFLRLNPKDKIPDFLPCNIRWIFAKNLLNIIQVDFDICCVRFQGVVSKTTKGDHLPERFDIIVHDRNLL
jgi:hypothetical protein